MVRLVVLTFLFVGLLTACSILPNVSSNGEKYDPRHQQSLEVKHAESADHFLQDDILRLDEGDHHPAVQVLLTQAEQARQQDNSQQALSYLDRARQIQPRNSAIFYRQAWLNFQLEELQQVQQLLQRARLFLRSSDTSHKILQRRINTLQDKVDAKLGY